MYRSIEIEWEIEQRLRGGSHRKDLIGRKVTGFQAIPGTPENIQQLTDKFVGGKVLDAWTTIRHNPLDIPFPETFSETRVYILPKGINSLDELFRTTTKLEVFDPLLEQVLLEEPEVAKKSPDAGK